MNELEKIEINIDALLSKFTKVSHFNIKPLDSRYFRNYDAILIPPKKHNLLFYFIVAHELGHKYNNKALVFMFEFTKLKLFQVLLEIDANRKAREYIRTEHLVLFDAFCKDNLSSYLK